MEPFQEVIRIRKQTLKLIFLFCLSHDEKGKISVCLILIGDSYLKRGAGLNFMNQHFEFYLHHRVQEALNKLLNLDAEY